MSKLIKITEDMKNAVRAALEQALGRAKAENGKVNFTFDVGTCTRKATVYFTEPAWLKMYYLIKECDKEVGWHGIARRGDDPEKDEYIISDILVYPQEVTGATVDTDQAEYETWLYQQSDEVFNNLRMQGHSHVNMGVTPSSTDLSLYRRFLDKLGDDMFYIFMIWNKKGDNTTKIYDLRKNVLFETGDVTVQVLPGDVKLIEFLAESKRMVRQRQYTGNTAGNYNGYVGGSSGPGYNYSTNNFKGGTGKNTGSSVPAVTQLPTGGTQPVRKGKRSDAGPKFASSGKKGVFDAKELSNFPCDDDYPYNDKDFLLT